MLPLRLDRRRRGTHFADRMQRIIGVCQDCGVLWHEERITFRNGLSETRRVADVEATDSVVVTPRYEKYGLHVNPKVLPRIKKMGSQFAYALNVADASIEVDGNTVYVRVPRGESEGPRTGLYADVWKLVPGMSVGSLLLGVDDEQQQLVLDMAAPTSVHCAVIGMSGTGKSTLMRTMILSAQMVGGSSVALFDPSGGFRSLAGHPSVWRGGLFCSAEQCELGLETLVNSMERGHERLTFVFVDEAPELARQRPRIREHLSRLAQAGRHAGFHLILGAQHLLASDLGSMTMRNIPVRLVGRVADQQAAYLATGRADTGAERLLGNGDFIVVNGCVQRHFQVVPIPEELAYEWAQRYPPREPRVPVRPAPERRRRATATRVVPVRAAAKSSATVRVDARHDRSVGPEEAV